MELGKGRLHYTEHLPIQDPQPLSFVQKHCVENDLRQFWKFKASSSFLGHGKFIARALALKVLWKRQWGKSNPAPIPLKMVGNTFSYLPGAKGMRKSHGKNA